MNNSIQHILTRVRPPRVKITYDVETGGAIVKKELPFIIGIISDLYGQQINKEHYKLRKFIFLDRDNFADIMQYIQPVLTFTVNLDKTNTNNAKESSIDNQDEDVKKDENKNKDNAFQIELKFTTIDDFSPNIISQQIPEFQKILNGRKALVDIASKVDGNDILNTQLLELAKDKDTMNKLSSELNDISTATTAEQLIGKLGLKSTNEDLNKHYKAILCNFGQYVPEPSNNLYNIYPFLMTIVVELDQLLSKYMDFILHHPEFQKLEGSWKGLHYLVFNSELSTSLKLRLFPATRDELQNDLEKAIEFDQSLIFKKIYEEEYGTIGGQPYSCLIYDYYFSHYAKDVTLMRLLSKIAAASHAPLISSVSSEMFNLATMKQLAIPRDLKKLFENSEFTAWNSFRNTEDSKYINLILPRILIRAPYDLKNNPIDVFQYTENVNGDDENMFCWGNAAFALGTKITDAFAKYNWTAAIRGVEGGGLVQNLCTYSFKTQFGDNDLTCPTETAITDRREKELSDLGFITLCHSKGSSNAVFFSAQSVNKPKKYNLPEATANAALSSRLSYLINASRFAHYIKMMMRDKIGSFMSIIDIQTYLQTWIADYILLSDQASNEIKAQYPLREAAISVHQNIENPGSYNVVIFLRPHFQLEELTVSLRLVAKIPALQGGNS